MKIKEKPLKIKKPLKQSIPPTKNKLDRDCARDGHNWAVTQKRKRQGPGLNETVEVVKCKHCQAGDERPFTG
jgi:hypothetical protein